MSIFTTLIEAENIANNQKSINASKEKIND